MHSIERIDGPVPDGLLASVLEAWNAVYPVQLRMEPEALRAFIDRDDRSRQYLSRDDSGRMRGWGLCFDREGARWFSLLVAEAHQGKGIGAALVRAMQADESDLRGWVIDHDRDRLASGEPYRSPLAFYRQLGFDICHGVRWDDTQISAVMIRWQLPPGETTFRE